LTHSAQRENPLIHLKIGWDWDSLRDDLRFQDLLHRMNFPEQKEKNSSMIRRGEQ